MGFNIQDRVSQEAKDNARLERDSVNNPADFAPGFGEDDGFGSFGSDDGFGMGGSTSGFGGGFGADSGFGGGFGGFGLPITQPQAPQPPVKSSEDKILEAVSFGGKGVWAFFNDFVKSFQTLTLEIVMAVWTTSLMVSLAIGIFALIFLGLGYIPAFEPLIAALIALGLSTAVWGVVYDITVANYHAATNNAPARAPEYSTGDDDTDVFEMGDDDVFSMDDDEFEISAPSSGFDFGDGDDFDDFDSDNDIEVDDETKPGVDTDYLLSQINIDKGMMTRSYIFEHFSRILEDINPTFDSVRVIPESSGEFDSWDATIRAAAELSKPSTALDMPTLISAKEKLFYIILEIQRVKWLKNVDSFVQELVNVSSYDKTTNSRNENIYGIGEAVGDKIYVKIMKGETAMVSVKDSFKQVKDRILSPKSYMPIIFGVDAEGNVIMEDLKEINSMLITGMPRSGKTWLILSIVAQMTAWMKPSELHLYLLDPKDKISDLRAITTPHVKKFVADDAEILNQLRHIVRIEGPRRKQILGAGGFVNIWDYKKANPTTDLPLIYVLIDEVVTLAERMDDEVKKEFQGLLIELVSQLPALGIRIFMIPHVVKDNILKKTMTDLIPCRISVRGDVKHIESTVGMKNFPHKLAHQGDMAVRLNNDEPKFIHSAVLSKTNQGNTEVFQYLTKFWAKIEPESVERGTPCALSGLVDVPEYAKEASNTFSPRVGEGNDTFTAGNVKERKVKIEDKSYNSVGSAPQSLATDDLNDLLRGVHDTDDSDEDVGEDYTYNESVVEDSIIDTEILDDYDEDDETDDEEDEDADEKTDTDWDDKEW